MHIIVHTDGGARGNPGPAAVGVVIEMTNDQFPMSNKNKRIVEISKRIGETTNNVAEYTAVQEALKELKTQIPKLKTEVHNDIQFYLDSNLVVQQLNGTFKVKDAKLRDLLMQIRMLEQESGGMISYTYVPREQNSRADLLVNQALDGTPHPAPL